MSWDLSLHVLTDESVPLDRLPDVVDAAVTGGATVIQLRAKHADAAEIVRQAVQLSDVIAGRAAFVIDDRLDAALAAIDASARVDGVHLGQSDVPPTLARRLLGPDALIGWTANTLEHFAAAAAFPEGTIDYLGVGVIRPTATKKNHPEALGVDGFGKLITHTQFPCIAIGGVHTDNTADLIRAGGAGIAVVSAVCAAPDPLAATRAFRSEIDGVLR